MTTNPDRDVLELVARYAPSAASVAAEWNATRHDAQGALILQQDDQRAAGAEVPLRFIPVQPGPRAGRWMRMLPVAASVATLVLLGVLVAVLPGKTGTSDRSTPAGSGLSAGPVFDPPAGLPAASLGDGQYSYRVIQQMSIDADGHPQPNSPNTVTLRDYIAPNGDLVSFRSGPQHGCYRIPTDGHANFDRPTRAFFAAMPTDVDALGRYLRGHVQGSSSRDEAVFVAVGDALREADALASPRLRAAMIAVLSRTPGVTMRQNAQDPLGRPAIRLDFINQKIRPGQVQSLYFAPNTFQLLAEQSGPDGQPTRYNGPSPAYDAPAPAATAPDQLTGPGFLSIMTDEKVVNRVPACPKPGP